MKLSDIKPDSLEAIICFAVYICAQDREISEKESFSLARKILDVIDNDTIVKSKFSRTETSNIISQISKLVLKNKSFLDNKINIVESGFFKNLLVKNEFIDLALRTARIVASSDGFHKKEKTKFNLWVDQFYK